MIKESEKLLNNVYPELGTFIINHFLINVMWEKLKKKHQKMLNKRKIIPNTKKLVRNVPKLLKIKHC